MRTKPLLALGFLLLCGCIFPSRIGTRYYLTQIPRTFSDSTADSIAVHLDEKLLVQLNATLILGRKEQLEQAACLRVEKIVRGDVYIDSVLQAAIDPSRTTESQIAFTCNDDAVPMHWHVVYAKDGWMQCEASPADVSPWLAPFPAQLIQCGLGVDSILAYRVRRR